MFLGLCSPFALLVYEAVAVLPASGSSDSVESAGFSHCRPGMPSPPSLPALRPVPFLCSQPAPMPPPHTDTSPRTRPSHPFVLRPQNSGLVPLPTETDPCGVVLEDRLRWFFILIHVSIITEAAKELHAALKVLTYILLAKANHLAILNLSETQSCASKWRRTETVGEIVLMTTTEKFLWTNLRHGGQTD